MGVVVTCQARVCSFSMFSMQETGLKGSVVACLVSLLCHQGSLPRPHLWNPWTQVLHGCFADHGDGDVKPVPARCACPSPVASGGDDPTYVMCIIQLQIS